MMAAIRRGLRGRAPVRVNIVGKMIDSARIFVQLEQEPRKF
jgi:hypothetical protein